MALPSNGEKLAICSLSEASLLLVWKDGNMDLIGTLKSPSVTDLSAGADFANILSLTQQSEIEFSYKTFPDNPGTFDFTFFILTSC